MAIKISNVKEIISLTKHTRQQKVSNKKKLVYARTKVTPKNLHLFIDKKTCAYKMVLAALMRMGKRHEWILVSQVRLAEEAGVGLSSVRRVISQLIADGLLIKNAAHRKVTAYRLSDIFKEPVAKKQLKHFTTAALFLPVLLLSAVPIKTALCANKHLIKERKKYFFRNPNNQLQKRNTCGVNFSKKVVKREEVENCKVEIEKIKRMELTRRGKYELLKFSPEAIRYANSKLEKTNTVLRDPFSWFCKLALRYSNDNNLEIRDDYKIRMLKRAGLGIDDPVLETNELAPLVEKKKNVNQNGMYSVYKEEEREELPIEEEVAKFENYLKTPAAMVAKSHGFLFPPIRVKEYYKNHPDRRPDF